MVSILAKGLRKEKLRVRRSRKKSLTKTNKEAIEDGNLFNIPFELMSSEEIGNLVERGIREVIDVEGVGGWPLTTTIEL